MEIDINFDFTSDTPGYWDNYWENNPLLGQSTHDPDCESKTLQSYQKYLYSKPLPNGEIMDLCIGSGKDYLTWKNFRFGSDSITASFRYKKNIYMIEQVAKRLPDYHQYIENFIHKAYTIGGEIIFPKSKYSINVRRGFHPLIKDRWDLTLECIRKYYQKETSPLFDYLSHNRDFFDLFVDFKGYVDFFCLQDCVSSDYTEVNFWLGNGKIKQNPLPESVEEYLLWIEKEIDFVEKRNRRIQKQLLVDSYSI